VTTPWGYDPQRPTGIGGSREPDPQPWDPAYTQPAWGPAGYGYGYGYGYPPVTPPPPPPRKRRRGLVAGAVAAVAVVTAGAVALGTGTSITISGNGVALGDGSSSGGSSSGGTTPTTPGSGGSTTTPGNGTFPFPRDRSGLGSSASGTATAAQQVGVVDIDTVEKYQSAAAAGTGMVLTSDGDILTNNHVIDGATSIKVTVVSTGKSYSATVVGTAPTKDIAVLHLANASGLATANFGDSGTVGVGDQVTGVGNAGGAGGTPSAAAGKVTALHRTITAADESGSNSETLRDVIVTDAPIQSGDSGGPLYNASGKVVGIDTAASTSGQNVGFAIPINTALSIAGQIQKGVQTSSIHIGYPGFLGISVAPSQGSGALVEGVLQGGPAASAGISAGDVITKVGGKTVTNSTALRQAVSAYDPGSKVSITYSDQTTGTHTVTVTLATGPAD
jgi:S1-C subfamily serine protease